MRDEDDVSKALASLEPLSYEALLKRFSKTFTNYDDNFDVVQGKTNQKAFYQRITATIPKLKAFKDLVKISKDAFDDDIIAESNTIEAFSSYEKDCMEYISESDKMLFYNMKNSDLANHITNFRTESVNPFNYLYYDLIDNIQDSQTMIEAMDTVNSLQNTYDKITKIYASLCSQLNEMETGKMNFKSMLSAFKGKEQSIQKLKEERDRLDKDRHVWK